MLMRAGSFESVVVRKGLRVAAAPGADELGIGEHDRAQHLVVVEVESLALRLLRRERGNTVELIRTDVLDGCGEIDEIIERAVELRGSGRDVELDVRAREARLVVVRLNVGPVRVERIAHRCKIGGHQVVRLAHDHHHADRADRIDVTGATRSGTLRKHRRSVV